MTTKLQQGSVMRSGNGKAGFRPRGRPIVRPATVARRPPRGGESSLDRCLETARTLARMLEAAAPETEPLETLELDEYELEWEGELDRDSADYVSWVQNSLNRSLGLRLDVDGISGPMTRSAVRAFQTLKGLAVDGVVGPMTEAALLAVGVTPPGGSAGLQPPAAYPSLGSISRSPDGTPLFRQSDPAWGGRTLGRSSTLALAGCAMTSMAMAISKISRRVVTPLMLDEYLDTHNGYSGNAIRWGQAASIVGLSADKPSWSFSTIDAQLASGRPVVIGIHYHEGSSGGANGTDHWIAVTARSGSQYLANDPTDGRQIMLSRSGDVLVGPKNYRSTGELVVIKG